MTDSPQPPEKTARSASPASRQKAPTRPSVIESQIEAGALQPRAAFDFFFNLNRRRPLYQEKRREVIELLLAQPSLAREVFSIAVPNGSIAVPNGKAARIKTAHVEAPNGYMVMAKTKIGNFDRQGVAGGRTIKEATQLAIVDILAKEVGVSLPDSRLMQALATAESAELGGSRRGRKPIGKLESISGEDAVSIELVGQEGPNHAPTFTMSVTYKDGDTEHTALASVPSKSRAENNAAQQILDTLGFEAGPEL